jgi:hypothetical protein
LLIVLLVLATAELAAPGKSLASPAAGSWLIVDLSMVKTMSKTHLHIHHSAGPQSGPYAERGK